MDQCLCECSDFCVKMIFLLGSSEKHLSRLLSILSSYKVSKVCAILPYFLSLEYSYGSKYISSICMCVGGVLGLSNAQGLPLTMLSYHSW